MGGDKEATEAQAVLDVLHDRVAGVFGGLASMDEQLLYEKLSESTWGELKKRQRAIEEVVHAVNTLPIASVLLHSAMPMIAFQIGVFYLYAGGETKERGKIELPKWMRHVIIYGDAERYTSIKRLAFRHGCFFMSLG